MGGRRESACCTAKEKLPCCAPERPCRRCGERDAILSCSKPEFEWPWRTGPKRSSPGRGPAAEAKPTCIGLDFGRPGLHMLGRATWTEVALVFDSRRGLTFWNGPLPLFPESVSEPPAFHFQVRIYACDCSWFPPALFPSLWCYLLKMQAAEVSLRVALRRRP